MMRALLCVPALLLAALDVSAAEQPAKQTQPASGKDLYYSKCGACHLSGGMGTGLLTRRLGAEKALIEQRTDVTADYVKTVVRNGILNMPRLSRAEVSDPELAAIAAYLSSKRGG